MSSEVPKWLEEAVKKCKEGDEHACRFVEVFLSKYFDARERSLSHIIGLLTGSGIATVVTSIRIVSIYLGIAIMILLITLLLLCWSKYREYSKVLEYLCTSYLDPPMFVKEANRLGIFILFYIVLLIAIFIIGRFILHI